jgi:hypothetical protein
VTFADALIRAAAAEVGVREDGGRNRGPRVDEYLRAARLDPAAGSYPWCAAFVVWCAQKAAAELGVACPLPRVASVHGLWEKSRLSFRRALPEPGAIFLRDAGGGKGHAGIVVAVGDSIVGTVEGNTNAAGSREGDCVARKTRPAGYVNIGYLVCEVA